MSRGGEMSLLPYGGNSLNIILRWDFFFSYKAVWTQHLFPEMGLEVTALRLADETQCQKAGGEERGETEGRRQKKKKLGDTDRGRETKIADINFNYLEPNEVFALSWEPLATITFLENLIKATVT